MAHSLVPPPPPPTTPSPISARIQSKNNAFPILGFDAQWSCHQGLALVQCDKPSSQLYHRRVFIYGLIGAGLGSSLTVESANAAKRPPPPPPVEKKDPSVSGVRAKVLASIKRKEAMKEEIAKLREKGKPVN